MLKIISNQVVEKGRGCGEQRSGAAPRNSRRRDTELRAHLATPDEPAMPPTCTISYGGGSAVVQMTASHLTDELNS
jgi:hypothetical protein